MQVCITKLQIASGRIRAMPKRVCQLRSHAPSEKRHAMKLHTPAEMGGPPKVVRRRVLGKNRQGKRFRKLCVTSQTSTREERRKATA